MKSLKRVGCSFVLVGSMLTSAPGGTHAEEGPFLIRTQMPPGPGLTALQRAVAGARRRLERPACQDLFSELADPSGHKLQENLDMLGQTPARYLGLIVFADASRTPHCRAGGVFAFTSPRSRVVYICGAPLAEAAGRNLGVVEAVLIHEELHSLGLGENPPTSEVITARVLATCPS